MKDLKESFVKIFQNERGILSLMVLNFLTAAGLFVLTLIKINPDSAAIKIGYGDIGGYRDGSWTNLIAYLLLAILFGVFHNFLALKVFKRRGAAMTKFFLLTTMMLILGTFVVLVRISEGA